MMSVFRKKLIKNDFCYQGCFVRTHIVFIARSRIILKRSSTSEVFTRYNTGHPCWLLEAMLFFCHQKNGLSAMGSGNWIHSSTIITAPSYPNLSTLHVWAWINHPPWAPDSWTGRSMDAQKDRQTAERSIVSSNIVMNVSKPFLTVMGSFSFPLAVLLSN